MKYDTIGRAEPAAGHVYDRAAHLRLLKYNATPFSWPLLGRLPSIQPKMLSSFALFFSTIFGHRQIQAQPDSCQGASMWMYWYPHGLNHDSRIRTEIGSPKCSVYAYPSSGGIVSGGFSAIEMVHLGLPRFQPSNRSSDANEEDDLALRMLQLGAHWWPSFEFYSYHSQNMQQGTPYDFHFPPIIQVAYPSSGEGVWVSKFTADYMAWGGGSLRKAHLPRKPDDWDGKISMTLTMDERCDVLKSFGATFYESVKACDDIPKTLEEGIERGKRYEDLMKKLDDRDYFCEWLDNGSGLGA